MRRRDIEPWIEFVCNSSTDCSSELFCPLHEGKSILREALITMCMLLFEVYLSTPCFQFLGSASRFMIFIYSPNIQKSTTSACLSMPDQIILSRNSRVTVQPGLTKYSQNCGMKY